MLPTTNIPHERLYQQGLIDTPFSTPEEVVAWLGAVQAQEYGPAKWSLGMRMVQAADDVIEQAFNEGRILRTHMMRPTWHFVTPEDIRWIMELTAPRVHALNAYMYRSLELDEGLLVRCSDLLAGMLGGGKHLTRKEIGLKLAEHGIVADGNRLGYILHHAELELVVCSGSRRGKQLTYALLDERAPQGKSLTGDEALAELTRRFFTGHGPATDRDFAWWSGLTLTDARRGLDMVESDLSHESIDDQTYWFDSDMERRATPEQVAFLLPTYDEFLIGYASPDRALLAGITGGVTLNFDSTIVIDGLVVGSWRRTFKTNEVVIEFAPLRTLIPAEHEAMIAAAERFGAFLGMTVRFT